MSSSLQTMLDAEVRREVERINGWPPPSGNEYGSIWFARMAKHREQVEGWFKQNADEAARLRKRVADEFNDAHHKRITVRKAEWQSKQGAWAQDALNDFLREIGVGDRTREAVIEGTDDTEPMVAARAWAELDSPGALLLLGKKGTGKTVAAAWAATAGATSERWICFCDGCTERQGCYFDQPADWARVLQRWPNGMLAHFVKAGHLADALHRSDGDGEWSSVRRAQSLVIDDLGREYADQHGRWMSALDLLIDDRHEARLRTVLTSNLTADEFKQRYGERIADRIRQDGKVVVCTGESLRNRRTA